MKNKKVLWIVLGALDVAIVIFLFVVHILMLANVIGKTPDEIAELTKRSGLIPFLAGHLAVYGFGFVIPLFLILAANIVGLMMFVRKTTKKEPAKISDLSEEQKEALRQELLRDLQGNKEEKKEE